MMADLSQARGAPTLHLTSSRASQAETFEVRTFIPWLFEVDASL